MSQYRLRVASSNVIPRLALMLCTSIILLAQQPESASTDGIRTTNLTGVIDRSQHPDQIPDGAAFRLVFRAFSEPWEATAEEKGRQRIKLTPLKLSSADLDAVFVALADHHAQYSAFLVRYQTAMQQSRSNNTRLEHGPYMAEREAVVQHTLNELRATLSFEGMKRFEEFVRSEKRHMTIAPFPAMY